VVGADGQSGWYGDFQFHRVFHAVNDFCIVDLSAFYLDVLKDRLYTFAPQSVGRRSAQTVLWRIAEALVRLVAPILTFTADEVWQYLPKVEGREASVHLALFPKGDELGVADRALVEDWRRLMLIRDEVLKALEADRKVGKIGKALEAKLGIDSFAGNKALDLLTRYESSLKELFNVSQVYVSDLSSPHPTSASEGILWTSMEEMQFKIGAFPASGHKCNRCWNYFPDDSPQHVRQFGPWENVCGRCADALTQMGYKDGQ